MGVGYLCKGVSQIKRFTYLNMDTNYVDDQGANAIAKMIDDQDNFTELYLCNGLISFKQDWR